MHQLVLMKILQMDNLVLGAPLLTGIMNSSMVLLKPSTGIVARVDKKALFWQIRWLYGSSPIVVAMSTGTNCIAGKFDLLMFMHSNNSCRIFPFATLHLMARAFVATHFIPMPYPMPMWKIQMVC